MKKPNQPFELVRKETAAMRKTIKEGSICRLRTCGDVVTVRVVSFNSETIRGIVSGNLVLISEHGLANQDRVEFNYSNIVSIS